MPEYMITNIAEDESLGTGTRKIYDLGPNPVSFIQLTMKFLNAGTNTRATRANVLAALSSVEVLFRGAQVISLNLSDLFALNCFLLRSLPWQLQTINTDNAARGISVIIPLGRYLFDQRECFPAVRRGELQLAVESATSYTNLDTVALQINQCELLGATPQQFLRATTLSTTPAATGDVDIDLPLGNRIIGVIVYSTTVPSGTAYTTTADKLALLIDNVQKYYAGINWESAHMLGQNLLPPPFFHGEHIHMENTASSYSQNADTEAGEVAAKDVENYAFLDLDPTGDLSFALDAGPPRSVVLRVTAGDTNALRVIPIEVIPTTAISTA